MTEEQFEALLLMVAKVADNVAVYNDGGGGMRLSLMEEDAFQAVSDARVAFGLPPKKHPLDLSED